MIPAPADVSGPPADATGTASGLAYKVLKGTGSERRPGPTDKVAVHYTGWTATTGEMFDSSVQHARVRRGADPLPVGVPQRRPGKTSQPTPHPVTLPPL